MRTKLGWLIVGLCVVVVGCGDGASVSDGGGGAPAVERTRKVLLIGIDGVRPDALQVAVTPNLDGLIAGGAVSYAAQTVTPSSSGPGWSTMLTGVLPEKHEVLTNLFLHPAFDAHPPVTTRIEAAQSELVTASIVHWDPINLFILTDADVDRQLPTDAEVAAEAAALLRDGDPDFLFLHFDEVDGTGHAIGFSPDIPEYLERIAITDGHIGTVLDALRGRPTIDEEDWLILSSTDHGGLGVSHGGITTAEQTIYVLVSGGGAASGTIEPAPSIADVAATALQWLEIEIDPAWDLDGTPVGLR
ncbi:MAG: alkaline phosphatase family protein [Candidatus Binatia bacterium]|nr:alkaline phosphatase family protein [Candidatus Binatia bacterium]